MGQTYTRQSSFADGDTITAALFNNEYNQLVNAFSYSATNEATTGHRHDGSAGEGGNIPQIGDLDFLNKIVVDSTNNRWGFYVQVSTNTVEQLRLQDGALIPVTDSDVDLGTSSLYFKDAYIDSITTTGNVAVGGNLTVTGTTTFNGGTITMGDAATDNVVFGADVNSNIIPNTDSAFDLGSSTQEWRDLYLDGTAHIDTLDVDVNATIAGTLGVTGVLTGTSLDISGDIDIDGTTNLDIVDIDGAVDMATTLTVAGNVDFNGDLDVDGTTNLDVVDIDGAVNIATTLLVTGNVDFNGDLDVDGTTNLDVVDIDGAVDMATTLTVGGEITAASLDISGNVDIDGTLETDGLSINSTTVTSTAAELNILDGVTSTAAELNILDGKAFLDEDNMASNSATGIASQQSIKAYVDTQITAEDLDITTDSGTIAIDLDSETLTISGGTGLDSSATGNAVTLAIDSTVATLTGSQTLTNKSLTAPTLTGTAVVASLDISGDIDVDGTTNLDVVDIDGAVDMASTLTVASNIVVGGTVDGRDIATDGTKLDGIEASADVTDATNVTAAGALMDSELTAIASVKALNQGVATGDSPQFVGITSTANVIVGGNLTVNGTTTTLNTATLDVEDKNITINYGAGDTTGSANGAGITIQDAVDASNDATILWDTTNDEFDFSHPINVAGKVTSTGTSVFASLDISGDIDVDGTTNLDVVDIDGAVDFASTTAHAGNATFADNAKAIFGAGSDLQIYHDGTDSFIKNSGTGNLYIQDTDYQGDIYIQAQPNENSIICYNNSSVVIYHDNSQKLTTTSTGINVTGTATMDGLTVDGDATISDATPSLLLMESDTTDVNTRLLNNGGDFFLSTINDASSSVTNRLSLDHATGDISFYEDTGSTAKFFWDASAEFLGIGTTSPAQAIDVSGNILSRGTSTEDRFIEIGTGRSGSGYAFLDFVGDATYTDYGLRIIRNNSGANTTSVIHHRGTGTLGLLTQEAAPIQFSTSNEERMRIDDSGNVGIGTAIFTNSYKTYIEGLDQDTANLTDSGNHGATLYLRATANAVGSGGAVAFGTTFGNKTPFAAIKGLVSDGATNTIGDLAFSTRASTSATALTERMRIDSLGNAMFNCTDVDPAGSNVFGTALLQYGGASMSRTNTATLSLNRSSSDGDIAVFKKDGSTVGSIGTVGGATYYAGTTKSLRINTTGFHPATNLGAYSDDTVSLGHSGGRFKDLYLSGGVYLGGTGAANKLDDYEEGTWTPAWSATSSTVTVNSAVYTKIGNLVTVHAFITNISPATSADQQTLTGLPFVATPNSTYGTGNIVYAGDADVEGIGMLVATGDTYFYFHYLDGTSTTSLTRNNWNALKPSGLALLFSASYRTDQ